MAKRRLEEMFCEYAQLALPSGAPAAARDQLRTSFMAGAIACVAVLNKATATPSLELQIVSDLQEEINAVQGENLHAAVVAEVKH